MHAVAAAPGNLFGWGMNGAGQIGLAQAKQQKPFSFLTIA
jgi:alpha-tubulin suppressor-like RCC1 family protein